MCAGLAAEPSLTLVPECNELLPGDHMCGSKQLTQMGYKHPSRPAMDCAAFFMVGNVFHVGGAISTLSRPLNTQKFSEVEGPQFLHGFPSNL